MNKIYTCPSCGKSFTRRLSPEAYLGDNCFDCSFWLVKDDYPEYIARHQVIINGEHFMAYAETSMFIGGCGGKRFKIQFFDGRVIDTNNLWCQGTIPERFSPMLQDNTVFLPVDAKSEPGGAYV